MTSRRHQPRPAPSDAAVISALLARSDVTALEARRQHLKAAIAAVAPRRSTILEAALKRTTRRMLEAQVAAEKAAADRTGKASS